MKKKRDWTTFIISLIILLAFLAFGAYVLYLRIDSGAAWYWWFR